MFEMDRVTIAITNMDAMVRFYNTVFDAQLQPSGPPGMGLYEGQLANFSLLMCPKEVAQVHAEQNRHQLRFVVQDIEAVIHTALEAGGTEITPVQITDTAKVGGVRDPDGNSLEFLQHL